MLTRIRLTYKQSRFEVIGAVLVTLGVLAVVGYQIVRLNSVVLPAGCSLNPYFGPIGPMDTSDPSSAAYACQQASDQFNAIRYGTLMGLLQLFLCLGPFIVAILLGAPLVAREIEQGTAPLSWSLIGSRRRWLFGRVAAMLLLLVPLLAAFAIAGDLLQGAITRGTSPWQTFETYQLRGLPILTWSLVVFALAAALGTVAARTLPAVFLSVVVGMFVFVGGNMVLEQYVLRPFDHQLITWDQFAKGNGQNWIPTAMTLEWQGYLDGKPWDGDPYQWYQAHQPPMTVDKNGLPVGVATAGVDMPQFWGPQQLPIGFSGDQYWPVVLGQAAIVLPGAGLLLGLAFYRVDRRRPY